MSTPPPAVHPMRQALEDTLQRQRTAYLAHPYPSFNERRDDLLKLKAFMRDHRDAICDAISAD